MRTGILISLACGGVIGLAAGIAVESFWLGMAAGITTFCYALGLYFSDDHAGDNDG